MDPSPDPDAHARKVARYKHLVARFPEEVAAELARFEGNHTMKPPARTRRFVRIRQRRQLFAAEYVKDFDAARAAQAVGYKPTTAQALLRHDTVQAMVERELASRARVVRRSTVVSGLLREATDRSPGSSHSARVSAWTALGKILGLTTERHVHTFEWVETLGLEEIRQLEALPDEELTQALEAKRLPAPGRRLPSPEVDGEGTLPAE